jgi:predicted permease
MIRRGVQRLLRLRVRGQSTEAEVNDELRAHFEARIQHFMRLGLTEAEARAEAQLRFGGEDAVAAVKQAAVEREERLAWLERAHALWVDVRYGTRSLVRDRGFSLVVIVTFALGIGANAAMFGLLDRLLLSGPAYVQAPAELMRVYRRTSRPSGGEATTSLSSYAEYVALREGARGFAGVAIYDVGERPIGRGAEAELLRIGPASADFFPLLGVQPFLGRWFDAADDRPGAPRYVTVLGYEFWQSRYGGARDVMGRTVVISERPYTVIGVAPKGFTGVGHQQVAVWIPMSAHNHGMSDDWAHSMDGQWLQIIARMAPQSDVAAAAEDATRVFRASYPGKDPVEGSAQLLLAPLHYNGSGEESLEVVVARWLFIIAVLVLLIGCANVANLQLARSARQRREISVRLALGISRSRLVRLLVTQSVLLALAGGALALVLAHWLGNFIASVLLPESNSSSAAVSPRVLLWTAVVAFSIGIGTALLPAFQATRTDLNTTLRAGARALGGIGMRTRHALTVVQAALSVMLLIGAGLFVRSFWNVRTMDLGFDANALVAVAVPWVELEELPDSLRTPEGLRRYAAFEELRTRVSALNGVQSASLARWSPLYSTIRHQLRATGWDSLPQLPGGGPYLSAVSAQHFATLGTRVLRGRVFGSADIATSEPVAIINQTMARTLWPARDPLGQCLYIGGGRGPCFRVVGVVEDTHRFELREAAAMQYYVPLGQELPVRGRWRLYKDRGTEGPTLLLRVNDLSSDLAASIRRAVGEIMPNGGYIDIIPLQQALEPQMQPWRLGASLFALFGLLALLIAAVGLYSVIAYMVASRRNELGMRRALGAHSRDLLKLVVGRGSALALAGIAVGGGLAWLLVGLLQPLLFEATPRDPLVFGATIGTLLLVALLASIGPGLRATRIDPATVLRTES